MNGFLDQAKHAMRAKDYHRAGDFFKMAQKYKEAMKAYQKGNLLVEASSMAEALNDHKKAWNLT